MKFYNMTTRKSVNIPDDQVTYTSKTVKGRKMSFAKAKSPQGHKLSKIVANNGG